MSSNFRFLFIAVLSISTAFAGKPKKGYIDEDDAPGIFNDKVLHEIHINFYQKEIWDELMEDKHIRDSTQETNYRLAEVIVDKVFYDSTGIRLKGQSSFDYSTTPKKSIKIDFDEIDRGVKHQGERKLNLLNVFKDPSFIREKLYFDVMDVMACPIPKSSYAKVYINGKYWGLYMVVQQIDKHYLDDRFDNNEGNLYKGQPQPTMKWEGERVSEYLRRYIKKHDGGGDGYGDLMGLMAAISKPGLHMEDPMAYQIRLDRILNTHDMMKAWAVNNYLVNIDAYNMKLRHNFYLYKNPGSGKFEWITYDGNYAFLAWSRDLPLKNGINFDILYVDPKNEGSLQGHMFQNPYYREEYLDIMYTLVNAAVIDTLQRKAEGYRNLIREAVYEDPHKFFTNEDFEANYAKTLGNPEIEGQFYPGVFAFLFERREAVIRQLQDLGYTFTD